MEKLLLIGGSLSSTEGLVRLVEREGYQVLHATAGASGLTSVRAERPAVVLVEHDLPGEDGVQVLKDIRAADPSCGVILVTPGGEMELAIDVLRAGALDYLRRPIDLDQLRVALGRARERRSEIGSAQGPVVLVIEDHEPTRRRLLDVLDKEGYQTLSADNGEAGVRLFQDKRVDVILVDLKMPRKDGFSVLAETKGSGSDVEVIVVTGYGDEDDVVRALREGAINFLRKPIDIEQMLMAIQRALEFQRTRRSLAFRNRDVELMGQLVVRLTQSLELVVQTPNRLDPEAAELVDQLAYSMSIGVVVVGMDGRIVFANRVAADAARPAQEHFSAEWLQRMGIMEVTEEQLQIALGRVRSSKLGALQILVHSKSSYVATTRLTLVRPRGDQQFLAFFIRNEPCLEHETSRSVG